MGRIIDQNFPKPTGWRWLYWKLFGRLIDWWRWRRLMKNGIKLPIIKKGWPRAIGDDIVSTQPMTAPVDGVFDYKYNPLEWDEDVYPIRYPEDGS